MRFQYKPLVQACLAAGLGLAAPAQAAPVTVDSSAVHIYQTPAQRARTGKPAQKPAGQVLYYAGSVFSSVKVEAVFWGPNVSQAIVAGIGGYFTALVNSTFVDQFSQYDTNIKGVNGRQGTNQTISRGSYLGSVQITPKNTKTTLTNKDVYTELKYQIAQGKLPKNDLNTLYMVYFPSNITIKLGNIVSCQQFGAYHEAASAKVESNNLFFGVEPDCGYSFNAQTIVSSHEFAEATTDNIPTPGSNPKYPQAWNTSNGYEIGDLCEGTQGTLTAGKNTYYVQQVWSNKTNACGTGNYTSP